MVLIKFEGDKTNRPRCRSACLMSTLQAHARQYPLMRPCDAVKLIFQNEFGGGHMIRDAESSLRFLREECMELARRAAKPLCENIGNGYSRLNLAAIDTEQISLERVNEIFVASSRERSGSVEDFVAKLDILREVAREGVFSFSMEELEKYFNEYRERGYPVVSHSATYREAYHPAYRVIDSKYLNAIDAK